MMWLKLLDKVIDRYYSIKSVFDRCPFGQDLQPYWVRRRELFSKFDSGIKLDREGLFSLTPEKIANCITVNINAETVVDAFCGLGGTAIAFGKAGKKVYAVDINKQRLELARSNSRVYGVENKIEFIAGDFLKIIAQLKAEAVFLDPPWGGVKYLKTNKFKLENFTPNGKVLLELAFKNFKTVSMLVPRQFDFTELRQFSKTYKIKDNYIRSKLYSRTIYFD